MDLPKYANLWLPAYLRDRAGRLATRTRPKRLWVALTDHYEPMGGNVSLDRAQARVGAWEDRWPAIAEDAPRDAAGLAPRFTFFYPQEEYHADILDRLAALSRTGTTDVEVHIHHDRDTAEGFVAKMREFCARLDEGHGLLHRYNGRLVFGFIHGNWALDNAFDAMEQGLNCGVTGELKLLRELGCYADFTMPSAPSFTQSRVVNSIYWTNGDPAKPRGYDSGVEATVGGGEQGELLMIEGPLGIRYRGRLMPRLEMGELAHYDLPTPYRVERWLDLAPRLGDDIFLKLFGHSAREDNAAALIGEGAKPGALRDMFRWIHEAAERRGLELHWASAWEMFRAVDAILQPAGTQRESQQNTAVAAER